MEQQHDDQFPIDQVMDSYRGDADSDDPVFGDLRSQFERDPAVARRLADCHRFDARLQRALYQVDVPSDLQARLLQWIDANSEDSRMVTPVGSESPVLRRTANSPAHFRARRRWMGVAASAMLTAAGVGLVAVWLLRPQMNVSEIAELAAGGRDSWLKVMEDMPWQHGRERHLSASLPSGLQKYRRWKTFRAANFSRIEAFDLSEPGHDTAILFIGEPGRLQMSGVPVGLPARPQIETGNWHVSVWQDRKGVLYVLAYQGGRQQYDRLTGGASGLA